MPYLRITRRTDPLDLLRGYKVFVNESAIGTLRRWNHIDTEVPAGPLSVHATIDWSGSNVWTGEAREGESLHLELTHSRGDLFNGLTGRAPYLHLHRR